MTDTTSDTRTFFFVLVKYRDLVQTGNGQLCEHADAEGLIPVAHETKEGALAAARGMVPEGENPETYAQIYVRGQHLDSRGFDVRP